MSEAFRGFVLLLSIVLWLPCLMPLLEGEMSAAEAGIRYGAALMFSWGGCAAVAALLQAYAPEPAEEPDNAAGPPVPVDRRPSGVETTNAEVLVERRSQPRDDDVIGT